MRTQTPLISIIIPTLNEEKYLPRLLNDLADQSFTKFETIVVDGLSSDATKTKVFEFTKLPIVFLETETRHVSFQRNLGASHAKGKWLLFLDADTQLKSDFLELLLPELLSDKIDCFTSLIEPDSDQLLDKILVLSINISLLAANSIGYDNAFGCALGIRSQVFSAIGGFDTEVDFGEDSDLVRRAHKHKFHFKTLLKPTYIMSLRRFRTHGHLNVIQKAALLHLQSTLNGFKSTSGQVLYPMNGGSDYHNIDQKKLFHDLQQLPKTQLKKIQSFLEKLERFTK